MSDKRIKAIWLASWWPRPDHPVFGIFTKRDAEAVALYCELVVLHARHYSGSRFEFKEEINAAGFTEMTVLCPKEIFPHLSLLMGYIKGIKKIVSKGWRPEVLHVHVLSIAGMAALLFNKRTKLPLFLSEHWSGYSLDSPPIGFFRRIIGKRLIPKLNAAFTVTQAMADSMKRLGFNCNYIVNPNVVDTDFFQLPLAKKSTHGFQFVHISSMDEEHKNISGLIRAFKEVVDKKPQVRLVLIGGDSGLEPIRMQLEALGIEKNVKLMGVQKQEKVRQILQESDALVLFSNKEGLPCVLLEAMAVGLPVISTDVPGLKDWVNEKNGILVPRRDESALVEAMLGLMDSIGSFDPKRIRKKIVEECSYPAVGKRISSAYKLALAAANTRS